MKNKKVILGMSFVSLTAIISLMSCGGGSSSSSSSHETGTSETSSVISEGTSIESSEESSVSSEEIESSEEAVSSEEVISSEETISSEEEITSEETISSEEGITSEEVLSSGEIISSEIPASSDRGSTYLDLKLSKEKITYGQTVFDGAMPIVTWVNKGVAEDASKWTQKINYSVTNNETGVVYTVSDVLPVGNYTVKARYTSKNKQDTTQLEVVEGNPVEASEGHGYTSLKTDDLSKYAVNKWAALGALGDGKFPCKDIDNQHPKMIVVPVEFANEAAQFGSFSSFDGKLKGEDFVRAVLDEAFFGKEGDTPWMSLSEYYEKSSYGQLHIEGEVSPVIRLPYTTQEFIANGANVASIVKECMQRLVSEYGYQRTNFDLDKDGYIDGINLIYATDQPTPSSSGSSESTWWNFTSVASGEAANTLNPGTHRYFWSRYDYVMQNYYSNDLDSDGNPIGLRDQNGGAVDTHTIIHENGHLMGLNDYYSYDHNEGPAGCVDMMDQNVGDHNSYSKMIYNWVAPKIIDGSEDDFLIDLPSFAETGEFLLLKNTIHDGENASSAWSKNPWDEYLVIQYYTPTVCNEKDSTGYGEWQAASSTGSNPYGHGGTYEDPGLQVFHVDSRTSSTFYSKTIGDGEQKYTTNLVSSPTKLESGLTQSANRFVHDNTPSRSTYGQSENGHEAGEAYCPYKEFSAIFASGSNSLASSSYASVMGNTKNLFGDPTYLNNKGEDNIYGGNVYTSYKMKDFFPKRMSFNDDSELNWTFSVEAQTASSIKLHFIRNK